MKQGQGAARGKSNTFFGGVLVLAVANLLVKLFGFFYKVPLNGVLGDEMANVNAAYSVYTLLYMISTAGIPVAVSVLISEARVNGRLLTLRRTFSVALATLALLGAVGTAALFLFSWPISLANSGGDAYLCLLAIAPALFFVCLSSVLRGYFQGFGYMTPTAVSGVIEAFGKMALGLFLVRIVLSFTGDVRLAAAYSVFAITLGIALGTGYLGLSYLRYSRSAVALLPSVCREDRERTISLFLRILKIAVPIALSSGVVSLASLIDNQMLRPLLSEYYQSAAEAKAVFSDYSTGAVTLFNMPIVLVYPIASALVPHITAARTRGDLHEAGKYVMSAFRTTALFSLPSALGMCVLARPILRVVFLGDPDMAEHAGGLLSLLALSIFPLALLAVSNAVLQAFSQQGKPLLSMLIGVAVKVVALLFLTPRIGPVAAPLGTLLFYLVSLSVNLYFVFRYASLGESLARPLAPLLASALLSSLSAFAIFFVAVPLGEVLALLLAILSAVLVYAVSILLLGGIVAEDLSLIPHGARLSRFFIRHHLLRNR